MSSDQTTPAQAETAQAETAQAETTQTKASQAGAAATAAARATASQTAAQAFSARQAAAAQAATARAEAKHIAAAKAPSTDEIEADVKALTAKLVDSINEFKAHTSKQALRDRYLNVRNILFVVAGVGALVVSLGLQRALKRRFK